MSNFMKRTTLTQSMRAGAAIIFVSVSLVAMSAANAKTIRIGNQGDALSLDPHSLNESLQLSVTGNVYEPMVGRNKDLTLAPILATSWSQPTPTVWRFELRKGVKFHDGTPFTADDVLFSFTRAAGDGSDMKSYTNDIKEVRRAAAPRKQSDGGHCRRDSRQRDWTHSPEADR